MENYPLDESSWRGRPWRRVDPGLVTLLLAAVGTVAIWRAPWGEQILWPFSLLATWYHEMGHALTAKLLGGEVLHLHIYTDGSGLAAYQGVGWGRLGQALVAAGGPVAPSVVGGLMLICSRRKGATRWCLLALGALLAFSAVVWIDWWESLIGAVAIFGLGAAILAILLLGGNFLRRLTLQLCGVQACIALWRDWDYFFAGAANVGGEVRHSDAAAIAEALWLPVGFWGFWLAAFSVAVLIVSLLVAFWPAGEKGEEVGG